MVDKLPNFKTKSFSIFVSYKYLAHDFKIFNVNRIE